MEQARSGARESPHSSGARGADGAAVPVRSDEDLRRFLPGVEPERRLDDWGRSEGVERALDRTVGDFLYRYWFRCEVEGVENVPSAGGALLAANHAGALLSPGGGIVAKALREEHPQAREVSIPVERSFRGAPGLSMLMPKVGCVPAHPDNVQRLLYDEQRIVLMFPEGAGATEKLYRDRYRLRRFGRGGFVEAAARGRVPIVPVCVVGAEEAAPVFARLPLLGRLTGLPPVPVTPTFPHLGPLGMVAYLPAKFRVRFLEPIEVELSAIDRDKGLLQSVSEQVRTRIQDNLFDILGARRSVWLG
jgi:1-acyl-sn-glycerol-3-phosphate acyltransferase